MDEWGKANGKVDCGDGIWRVKYVWKICDVLGWFWSY